MMTIKEFEAFLDENLPAKQAFMDAALDYQQAKNKRRPAKKRWADEKIEKATERMWNDFAKGAYEKISPNISKQALNPHKEWIQFIEKNEVLEELEQSIYEIEFE